STTDGKVDAIEVGDPAGTAATLHATTDGKVDGVPLAVLAGIVEGSVTVQEAISVLLALAAGKADGGETTTIHFRNQADTKDRITMTVDTVGDRTATVIDTSDL
ncbi:MAG: hypothetical protein DRH97_01735, partial [Chloroflexi bacterium]